MIKVAINGFGRIGRTLLRTILQGNSSSNKINVVAINIGPDEIQSTDLIFKYDTTMGTYPKDVYMKDNILYIDKHPIKIIAQKDPENINWKEFEAYLVVECSGRFTNGNLARQHLKSGAEYVLISAPATNEDITIIPGVNDDVFDKKKHKIISLGSCTTNALLPILKLIHDELEIKSGYMNTIHAYTNSQALLDIKKKDIRRSRAAPLNMIPTSTGATKVVKKILPELANIFDACSIRIPLSIVSFLDLSLLTKKEINSDQLIELLKKSKESNLKNILDISNEPLVSSDYKGNPHSVIVDQLLTQVTGKLIKIFGWYDNEWGYSCRLRDFIKNLAS